MYGIFNVDFKFSFDVENFFFLTFFFLKKIFEENLKKKKFNLFF